MKPRLSMADRIDINEVTSSATIQIGDSVRIAPKSRVYALQKEYPVFPEAEEDLFSKYDIFTEKIHEAKTTEKVRMAVYNEVPVIKVGAVDIIGVAASSVFHIGSTNQIDSQSRVKTVRQFLYPFSEDLLNFLQRSYGDHSPTQTR